MDRNTPKTIGIIGAGIIGLSTALKILEDESLKEYRIEVLAAEFSPHTTSDGAAGYWEPIFMDETPEDKVEKWAIETYFHILEHAGSDSAFSKGCFHCPAFKVFNDLVKSLVPDYWTPRVLGFRRLDEGETEKLFPNFKYGWTFTTVIIEGAKFLPYLEERLLDSGRVTFKQERLHDFHDLVDRDFDLVVNCTGIGARSFVGDELVRPIRGQVMRVKAPWIKYCAFTDDPLSYILVNSETVVLGGTKYLDDWNLQVSEKDAEDILRNTQHLAPSLKEAIPVKHWVGLRPSRKQVRIEREVKSFGTTELSIVHNYGHGGSGMTIFWGCARDCVVLIKEALGLDGRVEGGVGCGGVGGGQGGE